MLYKIVWYFLSNALVSPIPKFENNACSGYLDYFFLRYSPRCSYDPNVFSNQADILHRQVDHFETYNVTTEDGFTLTLHRIPRANPKGVVILLHPVTTDSIIYIFQGENALGFDLYNDGYEIWLPNNRGTPLSRVHKTLNSTDINYWDFGFHEIGLYDYSAIIKFISKKTKRNDLIFIGHSMSTSAALVYASLKPNEAKKYVKVFIALSPTAIFKNVKSPLAAISPMSDFVMHWAKFRNKGSLFLEDGIETKFVHGFYYVPIKQVLVVILNYLFGPRGDIDARLYNAFVSNFPKSASIKVFHHYAQIVKYDGLFRMYDYGGIRNYELYNTSKPPEYPLQNIKVPIHLVASKDDSSATLEDSDLLYDKLPEESKIYGKHYVSKLNHFGFHTSIYRFEVSDYLKKFLHNIFAE